MLLPSKTGSTRTTKSTVSSLVTLPNLSLWLTQVGGCLWCWGLGNLQYSVASSMLWKSACIVFIELTDCASVRVGERVWLWYVVHQGGGNKGAPCGRGGPQAAGQQRLSHQGRLSLNSWQVLKWLKDEVVSHLLRVADCFLLVWNVSSLDWHCECFCLSRRWTSTQWRQRTCLSLHRSACRWRGMTTSTLWSPTSTLSSPAVTRGPASPPVSLHWNSKYTSCLYTHTFIDHLLGLLC